MKLFSSKVHVEGSEYGADGWLVGVLASVLVSGGSPPDGPHAETPNAR
jgi:hypothetical protein